VATATSSGTRFLLKKDLLFLVEISKFPLLARETPRSDIRHNYDWRMRVGKISFVTLLDSPIDVNHSSYYFHSPDDRLMSSSFLRETTTTEDEISKTNITMTTVKTNCATMFQKSTDKIRIAAIQSADENINFIRKFSRSMNVEAIRD